MTRQDTREGDHFSLCMVANLLRATTIRRLACKHDAARCLLIPSTTFVAFTLLQQACGNIKKTTYFVRGQRRMCSFSNRCRSQAFRAWSCRVLPYHILCHARYTHGLETPTPQPGQRPPSPTYSTLPKHLSRTTLSTIYSFRRLTALYSTAPHQTANTHTHTHLGLDDPPTRRQEAPPLRHPPPLCLRPQCPGSQPPVALLPGVHPQHRLQHHGPRRPLRQPERFQVLQRSFSEVHLAAPHLVPEGNVLRAWGVRRRVGGVRERRACRDGGGGGGGESGIGC